MSRTRSITRRSLLALCGPGLAAALLAACGRPVGAALTPTPTAAPFVPVAPAAVGSLKDIPRNRTLVLAHGGSAGKFTESALWNPFLLAADPGLGSQLICEPLAFYSSTSNAYTMWLAESYAYTPDYLGLTIKLRSAVSWSDGQPFSAEDVAWTLSQLMSLGSKVRWGTEVQAVLASVEATNPTTVTLVFRVPSPRFFDLLAYKSDAGVSILPKHVFDIQDVSSFGHFDVLRGWPVTTSPWRVVDSTPHQKVLDRAADWWGVKAGVADLPAVERIVYLPDAGEVGLVQDLKDNKYDLVSGVPPSAFAAIFQANPKVSTWTGQLAPFGYLARSPHSLYLNTRSGPTADRDVRWALSYLIDRSQIVSVAWSGAATTAKLFVPDYPGLLPYEDSVKDLLTRYDTLEFNPAKADAILQGKGWRKGKNGLYLDATGRPFNLEILGSVDDTNVGPIIVQQLKKGGIASSYGEPPNMLERLISGDYAGALFGHDGTHGSDPLDSLRLYQSGSARPGQRPVNLSLWQNADYDRLVDQMSATSPTENDTMQRLWHQALELWLPDLPDLMLEQSYLRLPTNLTYWTGWPDAANPYVGSAHFHLTAARWLHRLKPTVI